MADKDKDGTVTFEEFKVWHKEHKELMEKKRKESLHMGSIARRMWTSWFR